MGFLRLNMVFLVTILLQQIDRSSLRSITPDLKCPENSHAGTVTDCDVTSENADVDKCPLCEESSKPGYLKCPENSHAGTVTDCDVTSENADVDKCPLCEESSKPGYLKCPENSHAGTVTDCDFTCGSIAVDKCPLGEETSKPGCKCNDGLYAQNGTSGESVECVKIEDCKVECGPNKEYSPTAPACPDSCPQPNMSHMCKAMRGPGCVCKEGYILSGEDNNACIEKSKCNCPLTES